MTGSVTCPDCGSAFVMTLAAGPTHCPRCRLTYVALLARTGERPCSWCGMAIPRHESRAPGSFCSIECSRGESPAHAGAVETASRHAGGPSIVDRVTLVQPGDSMERQSMKWILLILLVPTGIGQLIGLYFMVCGVSGWLVARAEPGYVPFRARWDILAYLALGLGLLYAAMGHGTTIGLIVGPLLGATIGMLVWLVVTAPRFLWHIIKLRPR